MFLADRMSIHLQVDKDDDHLFELHYKLANVFERSVTMQKVHYHSKYIGYLYRLSTTKCLDDDNDLGICYSSRYYFFVVFR